MNIMVSHDQVSLSRRVRGEFAEMPGLRLTSVQAGRLLGLDTALSDQVLQELVRLGFLCRNSSGVFARLSESVR
jgi:hypothetical protein